MRQCRAIWVLLAGLLYGVVVQAQTPTELRVTDVAVFKHGYGFVMAEGTAKTKDGWAVCAEVPQASLGTLWLYSPKEGVVVDRAVAEVRETKQTQEARDLAGLLEANLGAKAIVSLYASSTGDPRLIEGVVLKPVYGDKPPGYPQQQTPPQDDTVIWAAVPRPPQREQTLTHVMLQTDKGEVAVPATWVRDVTFAGHARREQEVLRPEQVLTAHLVRDGKPVAGEAPLGLGYLAKGLRWLPGYRLQITGEGRARLQLQGDLINDAVDLQASRLHLVIGVPHFVQEEMLSPLSLQVAWTKLSSYFAPVQQSDRDRYSRGSFTQAFAMPVTGVRPAYEGVQGMVTDAVSARLGAGAAASVTGEPVEELFCYRVPDLTLARGGRALVAIFDEAVTYDNVYLWNVVDDPDYVRRRWSPYYTAQQQQYQQQPRTPEQEALLRDAMNPKVWHALRLQNTTKAPWTTAPVLVMKDAQPVSQSMLLYTPVTGSVDVTTTVAPDIISNRDDLEIARTARALNVSGYNYDLVRVKGELQLTNRKTQAVRLIVKRQLEGAVDEASAEGEVTKLAEGFGGINPTSRIMWDFSLPAGQQIVLRYSYSVYVRV